MYLQEQKINVLTLRFLDEDPEREFFDDYFKRNLQYVRFVILVGIFLYSLFGILDIYAIPEAKHYAWVIRFGVFVPCSVLALLLTMLKNYRRFMHLILTTLALIAGFGIIGMLLYAKPPGSYLYYAGLMLVIIYIYTMSKLRFIYATVASWTIILVYGVTAVLVSREPFTILLSNLFFLLSANLLGMIACYQIERYIRTDFLQRRLIRELEEKKHIIEKEKILKDLHDGVGGVATNIAMLAEMAQGESSLSDIKKTLSSIWELSQESVAEIRGFLQSLDVREMNWQSCVAELRYFGNHMLEPHGISFDITGSVEDAGERPGTLLFLNLFRIYKEAISNIVKHAGARSVSVALAISRERLSLTIQDDGTGFAAGKTRGRGIVNMRMRAEEIGGKIVVTSDRGTRIELAVPLPIKYPAPVIETQA